LTSFRLTLALAATLAMPCPAAAAPPNSDNASIAFANQGGIYDWAADGDHGIYIESLDRKWYYAKLFAPCIDLPFAQRVGFVTEPGSGDFDKFSSILVRGQECHVVSFTRSQPPDSKHQRWRKHQAGAASR
jgi:Family of unknown function (DUF6491)